jgi:hypothetical protein
MSLKLPRLLCQRGEFGELALELKRPEWERLSGQELLLTEDGGAPKQRTLLKAGWDEAYLRLLFFAEDSHPWAMLNERDAPLYTEEVVEAFLDPVGDLGAYFEIEVNPNNAVLDLCVRKIRSGYRKDFRWRCAGLRTIAGVVNGGWMAEWAIPFASISGRPPVAGDCWRANFTRIDRPAGVPRELSAWSPTGFAQFHIPERFGFLEFC